MNSADQAFQRGKNEIVGDLIPLHYHYQMLQDGDRVEGFKKAIELLVPTGAKVLELGAGTGILSYFAAQKASYVRCVEKIPELAQKARELFKLNPTPTPVEVVQADALSYLPPEPVDVVICEMLHSALLREKQLEVISSFKKRYRAQFGDLPLLFLPEATVLGVEPIQRNFEFAGFHAPIVCFQSPGPAPRTLPLGNASVYATIQYAQDFPTEFHFDQEMIISHTGTLNAFQFITSNALAILVDQKCTLNWMNQNIIFPIKNPLTVSPGDQIRLRFSYKAGDEIHVLQESIQVDFLKREPRS
ncbi:MAG: methyltransferase domain-containing protein [Verrucomicrobiota bacterium]